MTPGTTSRTKIIATIGPVSSDAAVLTRMIEKGIDVCRLNFSHGSHSDHAAMIETIRTINRNLGTHVAILADLQGPKLRIGQVENNRVELKEGNILTFVTEECMGTAERVYLSYKPLPADVTGR
jgi:pyruvate kinase